MIWLARRVHQKTDRQRTNKPLEMEALAIAILIIIAISLVSGSILTLLVLKMMNISTESFTVSELVSFLFGIALSAASTILAIVAISLGKVSEQAMVDRSDESIKLQNDVFAKTIEVLQRIESSTGVTEKRIEDIISGRAGAISDKIAEKLIEDRGVRTKSKDAIRRDIQQSVYEGLSSDELESRQLRNEEFRKELQEREERRGKAENAYQEFHDNVVLGLANSSDVKSLKIGEGSFDEKGDSLFDGVYEIREKHVAVATFSTNQDMSSSFDDFDEFLDDIAKEIASKRYSMIFLAFDGELTPKDNFYQALKDFRELARSEISNSIIDIHGESATIITAIIQAVNSRSK